MTTFDALPVLRETARTASRATSAPVDHLVRRQRCGYTALRATRPSPKIR
jgi:hypothetical protein